MTQPAAKRPRGRPVEHKMPEPIPDTHENTMRAILATPPKADDEWSYLRPGSSSTTKGGIP
jgi:hypothetical protein